MKKTRILFALFIGLIATNLSAQVKDVAVPESKNFPIMTFEKTNHDFGTINEGDRVETVYKFKNTGNAPLLISRIKASCGCTVPTGWKKEAILPGEESEFTVKFNSRNKPNKQHKSITITCNTEKGREVVRFVANVIPDPELVKIRAERAAKRKKAMEERKAKKAAEKGNAITKKRQGFNTPIKKKSNASKKVNPIGKAQEASKEEIRRKKIERKKSQITLDKERIERKKLQEERKKVERERKAIDKKEKLDTKKAKKSAQLSQAKTKEELKLAELKRDALKKEEKRKEKEYKVKEKNAKKAEKQAKIEQKRIEKERKALEKEKKANEKALKKAAKAKKKAAKKAEKEAKRVKKITNKIADKQDDLDKAESKILKKQHKLEKAIAKGKLSPQDILKKESEIKEIQDKADELKLDIKHLNSKL